jgi:hypothetical protein
VSTDQIPDDAQPETGQDDAGQAGTPYAEYLDRIPEQFRGDVEPVFKDWDANVTRRFQDQSEFRKSWEPYQDTGISQHTPEQVKWSSQFLQALDNPQAIKEWYESYAEQNGLTPAQAEQQADEFQAEYEDPTAALLQAELSKSLGPITKQLEQFSAWQQQQETTIREAQALERINSQLDELKAKHPDEFNREMVERFVSQYTQTDPQNAVQRAFQDWQQIRNSIQKDTLQSKVNVPATPESGGYYDGTAPPVKNMKEASEIALQMLRGTNQQ